MSILRIGRGTGHLAVVVVVIELSSLGDVFVESSFNDDAADEERRTCLKLLFRASAEGQDLARSIRLTARFDALFKYLVSEAVDFDDKVASAGAIQKSISLTFARGILGLSSMSATEDTDGDGSIR
jgi:hypothetical protein